MSECVYVHAVLMLEDNNQVGDETLMRISFRAGRAAMDDKFIFHALIFMCIFALVCRVQAVGVRTVVKLRETGNASETLIKTAIDNSVSGRHAH